MAGIIKRALDLGLPVGSWVGVFGVAVGATYYGSTTIKGLQDEVRRVHDVAEADVRRVHDVAEADLMRVKAEMEAAVANARRETADRFLQLGFTEEYQKYQNRLSLGEKNDKA